MEKKCEICENNFSPKYRVTKAYWESRRFCSVRCARVGMRGQRRSSFGKRRLSLEECFWKKVDKKAENECWEWKGSKDNGGYGVMFKSRYPIKWYKSNRLSWEIHFGDIPEGLLVCHKCDNPACINPKHLWLGTIADNNRDRENKGRGALLYGENNPNAKLTKEDIMKIKELRKTGMTQQKIADMYRVSQVNIGRILSGRLWLEV